MPKSLRSFFLKEIAFFERQATACAVLVFIGFALGCLGRFFWFFDLASHFQIFYLFGIVVILLYWVAKKFWVKSALASGLLVIITVYASLPLLHTRPCVDTGEAVSFLSFNVLGKNEKKSDVIAYIREQNADIVGLYEVRQGWADAFKELKDIYPHQYIVARDDNFGIAVLSRHVLGTIESESWDDLGLPIMRFTVEGLTVFALHPAPPVSKAYTHSRNLVLQKLDDAVSAETGPVVFMGDLNATPWSWPLRSIIEKHRLSGVHPVLPLGSWPSLAPFLNIPIDHIYYKGPGCLFAPAIGPYLGSDHRPVRASIRR